MAVRDAHLGIADRLSSAIKPPGVINSNTNPCRSNLTLVSLPPYSPELKPVENLWHCLWSHHWSNRMYSTVGDLFDAVETAWRSAYLDPAVIRTI